MAPDGLPIYDESGRFPRFTTNRHSGVTPAGAHADIFAPMVIAGMLLPEMASFNARRFHDVRSAA